MLPVKRPREEDAAAGGKKVVADGLLEFFIDLLQTLHKENENSTFSPLSISAALSLAYLGAAGKTRDEIGRLLRGPTEEKIEEFHKTISGILGTVIRNEEEKPNGTTVTLANGVFMQEPLNVKQSYLNDATTLYKSEVTKVDFEKNGEQTVAKINGWVSEKTKGRILQLFDGPLPPDTLFLLVNTLYFVSTWHYTFYESQTKVEKFFNGKEEIMVHMMRNTENVGYVKNKSLQFEAISMKYVEWGYRMCIILPNAEQSLHNVINNLQLKDVQDILTGSREPKAVYKIPRFKFSSSLSLKDTLSKLGIQEAFDTANFSNMLEEPVSLADVTHAAEIEIDENGTKASAVSAGRFHLMSGPSVFFTANRPFLALLYHQPTSTILFSTTVYNPTAA